MVRIEEAVTHLAPVVMLRDMIEPLQRDLLQIANSVQELTRSDLELKELHKALMVERAKQEEARHRVEIEKLQEELAAQRAHTEQSRREHQEDRKQRGVLVWISKKAHPVVQFFIALAVALGLIYGFALWLQAHYR